MYIVKESPITYVRSTWYADPETNERHLDPATEYWGLVFAKRPSSKYVAALINPSLQPRILAGSQGEQYWGVELEPYTYLKDIQKQSSGTMLFLPVEKGYFTLGGKTYAIPHYDELGLFLEYLVRDKILRKDGRIATSLKGNEKGFSERNRQRWYKKITGLSKKQIAQLRRARHASHLLQRGVSPVDAALLAGYTDQSHLTHALKRLYASTPAQFAS